MYWKASHKPERHGSTDNAVLVSYLARSAIKMSESKKKCHNGSRDFQQKS
jgi:hypothetical protein